MTTAGIAYESGNYGDDAAPECLDLDVTFGQQFAMRYIEFDGLAKELGIVPPSSFIWYDPMIDADDLDEISEEEFESRREESLRSKIWIDIDLGIQVFEALSAKFPLTEESRNIFKRIEFFASNEEEEKAGVAVELACFHAALVEAKESGEQRFHIELG